VDSDHRPDYHALDRLYAIQSEERQERRGLETRAGAGIAAALTAVAFSANAVSDRLSSASALAIVLLALGAGVLFFGVFLSTFALLGGSSTTLAIARQLGRGIANVNTITVGAVSVTLDSELNRASVDVDDAARTLRRFEGAPVRSDVDVAGTVKALDGLAKVLRALSGSTGLGIVSLSFGGTEPAGAAEAPKREVAEAAQSDELASGLREPEDLGLATDRAEAAARRLRQDNAAAVIVLKASSFCISSGVLILVIGVVVALASPAPATAASPAGSTTAPATTQTTP
jgi:hypothetical protein